LVKVPWSGYDLINAFNTWKKTEEAGRVFVVTADGTITKQVTGLAWRHIVSAQVFEEAAVDLSHALSAYSSAKQGTRAGHRVGFPGRKRKGRCRDRFRLRNKQQRGRHLLRVGEGHPRSVTLPKVGQIRVHDDTRSIRRLLHHNSKNATPRAKILFATIARRGTRWYVHLNVQAPDFHLGRCHWPRPEHEAGRFVGVDRASSRSRSPHGQTGLRLGAGLRTTHSGAAFSDYGATHAPCREPSMAPATASEQPDDLRANMPT
jgi:putative transposase